MTTTAPQSLTLTSSIIHPTNDPKSPLYYLPTSLSSHSLRITLHRYTPTLLTIRDRTLLKDHDSALYEINKIPVSDNFTFHSLVHESKGAIKFTPGWLWGGTYEAEYEAFDEASESALRAKLVCSDGRNWFLYQGEGGVGVNVAEETVGVKDRLSEGGETLVIKEEGARLSAELREAVVLTWVVRIWREKTKTEWFSKGARDRGEETGSLRTW